MNVHSGLFAREKIKSKAAVTEYSGTHGMLITRNGPIWHITPRLSGAAHAPLGTEPMKIVINFARAVRAALPSIQVSAGSAGRQVLQLDHQRHDSKQNTGTSIASRRECSVCDRGVPDPVRRKCRPMPLQNRRDAFHRVRHELHGSAQRAQDAQDAQPRRQSESCTSLQQGPSLSSYLLGRNQRCRTAINLPGAALRLIEPKPTQLRG